MSLVRDGVCANLTAVLAHVLFGVVIVENVGGQASLRSVLLTALITSVHYTCMNFCMIIEDREITESFSEVSQE